MGLPHVHAERRKIHGSRGRRTLPPLTNSWPAIRAAPSRKIVVNSSPASSTKYHKFSTMSIGRRSRIVQVSAPDEEGFCSFGVSCDYTKPAAEKAKIVIAEVNDQMPYIKGGDNLIHISKIDRIVLNSAPLFELPARKSPMSKKASAATAPRSSRTAIHCNSASEQFPMPFFFS